MSLEQAIRDNTAAVVALTAALSIKSSTLSAPPVTTRPTKPSSAPTPQVPEAKQVGLTYADVATVVNEFVKNPTNSPERGAVKARAIFASFQLPNLIPLRDDKTPDPVKLAAVMAAFQAVPAGAQA